ncbi:MAG: VWA domain-containing protein [Dehalococcoidia bacterium]|nr:VWA domain-containing protein [Dehalococcoidia bacterium]
MLSLDLNKSAQAIRLNLDKAGVRPDVKAELIFDIDVSGSFEHEHEEGTTSRLVERLVPYGMVLDPDGKMDVFTFSDGEHHVHYVGVVTPDDAEGYLRRRVVDRVPGWGGGTTYSYVLERNLEHFGWLPQRQRDQGILSRFFGRPAREQASPEQKRSLVLFVTDGENHESDEARTVQVLEESQRRGDRVYFLFLGFCDTNPDFRFIREAAQRFDNTGALIIQDLRGFIALSDDELSARLLAPELIAWLKAP